MALALTSQVHPDLRLEKLARLPPDLRVGFSLPFTHYKLIAAHEAIGENRSKRILGKSHEVGETRAGGS
jgi:hypothetical protein